MLLLLCRTFHQSISGGKIRLLCVGNASKTGTFQKKDFSRLANNPLQDQVAAAIRIVVHFFSDFVEVVRC